MKQGDTIGSFQDQINILINCARAALQEEKDAVFSEAMMTPMVKAAVDVFIRGLPTDLSKSVDLGKPATLEEAYKEAVRLESRMEAHTISDGWIRGGYRGSEGVCPEIRSSQPGGEPFLLWG